MVAIYFDLDGTLISYPKDFRSLFDEALGFRVDDEVYDLYVDELFSNLENLVENPYFKAFKEIRDQFGLEINPEEVAEEYISVELNATELNGNLFDFLKIMSKNHKIGILTNGATEVQAKKIDRHGISDFVDEVIISNDVGVRKPNEAIFELAKKNLDSEEHIYIGDTFEEDIKPASETGFKTIYISGEESADLQSHGPESFGQLMDLFLE